ncbi:pca operon transcription factor PcaQ [Algihabitans albus]|uniref:pca operon transcription factor PcaQ n=1 Tax=Algihabitans albus TaxID=2164067 RepID=UPI000E5D269E|nr:pca operon transcription factor PcaQ [Algihabitans albus]
MKQLPAVSLRHIQCFTEVARCGSVQEAARRLSITQPAASRRLKDLETLLDVALFDRTHRSLALTDAGRVFLRYAEAASLTLRKGVDALTGQEGVSRPLVSLGALPTAAGTLVPAAAARLRTVAPHVLLRVETGASRWLLGDLRAGHLDLIVGRMPEPERMRGLTFTHLYSDRLGFVVRAEHPLAKTEDARLPDVLAYPVIVPPETAVIRRPVEAFLLSHGLAWPEDRIESTSVAFCASHLVASDAVWIISRGVALPRVQRGDLAFLPVDTAATLGSIGITTRDKAELSPEAGLLVDALKAAVVSGD